MKKKKLKIYKFYDSLYLADIHFCFGDPEEFDKHVTDNYNVHLSHDPLSIDGVEFSVKRDGDDGEEIIYFIYLRNQNDFPSLAHETIHLVSDIFSDRGVSNNLEKEDEHFTYYHSYLMKLFISKIKESKKRKKTKKKLTKKK